MTNNEDLVWKARYYQDNINYYESRLKEIRRKLSENQAAQSKKEMQELTSQG